MQTASGSSPNVVSFTVSSNNKKVLDTAVNNLQQDLESLDGVVKVTNDLTTKVEEVQINVIREKAMEYGIAPAQIAQTVNNITRGVLASQIIDENDNVFGVYVKYGEMYRSNFEQLKQLQLRSPAGQYIALKDVATVDIAEGPVAIRSVDQASAISFSVKYESKYSLGEMSDLVDEVLQQQNFSEDIAVSFGGDRELLDNSQE